AQRYFLSQTQQVGTGTGTAVLALQYAASNAPLGLHTDGLRIEMRGSTSSRPTILTLPFDKWWLRPEGRLLSITAEINEPGRASTPADITLQLGNGQSIEARAPVTTPVRLCATVKVRVPKQIQTLL